MSDEIDPRLPDMRKREVLIVHIAGLETTLTKRNERIAHLEQLIADGGESAAAKSARGKAYKRGWKDCAQRLMSATSQAAASLTTVNRVAWGEYLVGDGLDREAAEARDVESTRPAPVVDTAANDQSAWATIEEAAESLGVSTKTIRRRIADGTIEAKRLGPRLIRIKRAELSDPGRSLQYDREVTDE